MDPKKEPIDEDVSKEFGLSSLAVNNGKTVWLLLAIIIIAGISSYIAMPREAFPEIQVPEIYVSTAYPGNSPEVIEEKITKPIEKEVNTIKGVEKITSTSIHGYSSIKVEFSFDVTPEQAKRKVKDAVDKVQASVKKFPKDLPAPPNVIALDVSEIPILNVNLSGRGKAATLITPDDLKEYAEELKDRIEALPEINKVDIRGLQEKELTIQVDHIQAEARNVSFDDIEQAINRENLTVESGEVDVDGERRTLRIEGEFSTIKDFNRTIIKRDNYDIVYLEDVANVYFGDGDPTSYARQGNNKVVMLDVKKRSGANVIDAAQLVKDIVDDAREHYLPSNIEATYTNDTSVKTRDQVDNLENSIIFGVLLVVLVLLFFLGIRNALFVGVAIPLSMFMAFMLLKVAGVTLNVMVLFSLVLALGMLVDNGIVVVENIYRMMEKKGMEPFEAAKKGVGEVALPIIASTATTLAAFVPLAFWPGLMGEFMQYLPITLIIVLGSSLFVALVINPVLTSVLMRVGAKSVNKKRVLIIAMVLIGLGLLALVGGSVWFSNLLFIAGGLTLINVFILTPASIGFQQKVLPRLESAYHKFLSSAVGKRPRTYLIGTLLMLVFSFMLIGVFTPKVEFFPVNQPNYVNIYVEHPIGTDIAVTNQTTDEIEKLIKENFEKKYAGVEWVKITDTDTLRYPLIKSVIAQVGEGTSDPNEGVGAAGGGSSPHKARITVNFADFQHRYIGDEYYETSELLQELDTLIRIDGNFHADVRLTVTKNSDGPPQQPPINLEIRTAQSQDYIDLIKVAEDTRAYLIGRNIQGVDNLKTDVVTGKPELPLIVNREAAGRYLLSTGQIASALRTAVFGKEIGTFTPDGETDDYDIRIRYDDLRRNDLDALMDQKLTFRNQNNGKILQVPVRSLVLDPEKSISYSAVKRKNGERLVTIFSGVKEGFNPTEVVAEVKAALQDYEMLKNKTQIETETGLYNYKFTGQQEEMAKEMAFLGGALMIAVFLILLIIITQFNSYSSPIVILSAVVLSLIGVFLGLVIFQMDFIIIMTMIGIISLAGVVVNNAIVLIDYTNLIMQRKRKEKGMDPKAYLPIPDVLASILEGGETRLRPVLLTAITTVLGLIPLAMGININFVTMITEYDPAFFIGGDNVMFFGPMSWTIIFGLTFATFLTLVIVPVMYYLLLRMKYNWFGIDKATGIKKSLLKKMEAEKAADAQNLDPAPEA